MSGLLHWFKESIKSITPEQHERAMQEVLKDSDVESPYVLEYVQFIKRQSAMENLLNWFREKMSKMSDEDFLQVMDKIEKDMSEVEFKAVLVDEKGNINFSFARQPQPAFTEAPDWDRNKTLEERIKSMLYDRLSDSLEIEVEDRQVEDGVMYLTVSHHDEIEEDYLKKCLMHCAEIVGTVKDIERTSQYTSTISFTDF